ncbi:hypothetical protein MHYP_G00187860 [Metynnis hypsauchen]
MKATSENQRALLASYKVAYQIAQCKKPHTIAEELILPAALDMVSVMLDDKSAAKIKTIPLSNDTVARRINDIANDLQEQLIDKLKDKRFALQFDEATDSNKDCLFVSYVRFDMTNSLSQYDWVRDPFNAPAPTGFSSAEEDQFIDMTTDSTLRLRFTSQTLSEFWLSVEREYPLLGQKVTGILIPFATSYLCETGFSAVTALKTKYRSQLNIEQELRVAVSCFKPRFEKLCAAKRAHCSH